MNSRTRDGGLNLPDHVPVADWVMLGMLSFLWGGSFFFYKVLAPVLPPFTLVLGRVGLAALLLGAVLLWRRQPFGLTPASSASFLLLGLLNCVIPFSLFAWSEQHITSGLAALLNSPTPILTALVAHVATADERMNRRTVVGVLCGFAGVLVLIGPTLAAGIASADMRAEAACLAASLCYAVGGVLARRMRTVAPLQFATGQMAAAALLLLPLALVVDRPWRLAPLPLSGWSALIGIAVLSTALAYLLYFRILASSGATRAALVTFLVPVSALLLGAAFLHEPVVPRDGAAILLIGAGLAAIDGRLLRVFRRRASA